MIHSESVANIFTEYLFQINAIKINPEEPFTWASGWKSPIYCDNRLTLSYPDIRNFIKNNLSAAIQEKFASAEIIAGVATAGIPHGALIADILGLPFIYVRSEAKKHGLANQIEGKLKKGDKIVVVEDLISTGMSSLQAVEALRSAGADVVGLAALFTYGFDQAQQAFDAAKCNFITLTDYETSLQFALSKNMFDLALLPGLMEWRRDPSNWGK